MVVFHHFQICKICHYFYRSSLKIYIKENIITKLQKLYSPPKKSRTGNKSPALFVEKLRYTGDLSPMRKIFIERSATVTCYSYATPMQKILKKFDTLRNGEWTQKLAFLVQIWPALPLKDGWNWKNGNIFKEKLKLLGYPNISKPRPYLLCPFHKNRITLWTYCLFGEKRKVGSKVKGSELKSNID